jgi:N-acyl amino acid synthase of PEP-CTERM/exosortase system
MTNIIGAKFRSHTETGNDVRSGARSSIWRQLASDLKVVFAHKDELRQIAYRVRYQVYCLEARFEPALDFPSQMESDEYDAQSLHALLVHRKTGIVLGTTRLIMPVLNGSALPLPVRNVCADDDFKAVAARVPFHRGAEISRFAISKNFRRHLVEKTIISEEMASVGEAKLYRVLSNYISLRLMQAVTAMAMAHDITHTYAIMEPSLLRMLRHLALYFEDIGPVVYHHGWRQPCFCNIDTLLAAACAERPEVWAVLTNNGQLQRSHATEQELVGTTRADMSFPPTAHSPSAPVPAVALSAISRPR